MFAPLLGGLASGILGLVGAKQSNAANAQQAANQMDFQQGQTEQQMEFGREMVGRQEDFQRESVTSAQQFAERMAGTSYQRGMADMKAAGLNPILAYQQGGATSPTSPTASGASASVSAQGGARAQIQDALSPAISRAFQGAMISTQLEQAMANVDLTKAQTARETKAAGLTRQQQWTETERAPAIYEQGNLARAQREQLVPAQAASARAQARFTEAQDEDLRSWGPPGGWRSNARAADAILERFPALRRWLE